jgi:hypothetical protein
MCVVSMRGSIGLGEKWGLDRMVDGYKISLP